MCVFARTGEYGLGVVRSERVFAQLIHSSVEVGHMLPAGELHSLLPALCISSASCQQNDRNNGHIITSSLNGGINKYEVVVSGRSIVRSMVNL